MWLFGDILERSKNFTIISNSIIVNINIWLIFLDYLEKEILILNLKYKHNIYIYTHGYAYFISEYISIYIYILKNLIKYWFHPKVHSSFS